MSSNKQPLLDEENDPGIQQLKMQFDKVKKDFTDISDYHDIVRGQADFKKAQNKKGVRDVPKGPNGEEMLSSVQKLKKKSQLD